MRKLKLTAQKTQNYEGRASDELEIFKLFEGFWVFARKYVCV